MPLSFFFFFFAVLGLPFRELPHGMWNLGSPTRDGTYVPCIGRQILNHWTIREVLQMSLFFSFGMETFGDTLGSFAHGWGLSQHQGPGSDGPVLTTDSVKSLGEGG